MKKLLLIIAALFINFNLLAQVITVGGIKYEIDGSDLYIIELESDFNPTELIIPETITYQNKTYKIEEIGNGVFSNCTNLTTLEIQSSITIGRNAFNNGCLVKVTCKSTTPPTILKNAFGTNSNLEINVPEGCINTYKNASDQWKSYAKNIVGPITFYNKGNWINEANWDGLPEGGLSALTDKEVIIKAEATILGTDKIIVNNIKINGGSIIIEEGGQLIHNNCDGDVTVQKNIIKYSANPDNTLVNGWYSISSPFGNLTLSSNNFLTDNYELFRYDEPSFTWENHKAHTDDFKTLESGRGYIYANKDDKELNITGKLNTEDKTYTLLTAEGNDLTGFNLIGNPYMHNIYKGKGASIDNENLRPGYYTLTYEGEWATRLDSEAIVPMQSILVKTNAETKLEIKKTNAKPSAKRSDKGTICINVANNEYNDVAYISFNGGIGLDKIEHRNNEVPMVYVPVDGTDYAIAVMDENAEEIPVNFEAKKMGEYTIGISAEGRKYSKLTLIDKQDNNKEIDMLKGNYTFLATTTDDPARFILKVSLNNNQEAAFYTENNSIIIENIKGKGDIQVYDVMGRPVIKQNTNDSNCQLSTSSLANGVYVIQLIDENGTQVQKVIVNN
ncbi:MAG: T9SS type A sorting domain-containing protein [Bacteroidales bacterium]|nr:T9SS type A sorting domain-containing protein [Bacteroidales bacterium]